MRRRTSGISKILGGNDSVMSMVAPSLQDYVTEEPIAKPALVGRFLRCQKGGTHQSINYPLRLLREIALVSEGRKKKKLIGGHYDFPTRLSKT